MGALANVEVASTKNVTVEAEPRWPDRRVGSHHLGPSWDAPRGGA